MDGVPSLLYFLVDKGVAESTPLNNRNYKIIIICKKKNQHYWYLFFSWFKYNSIYQQKKGKPIIIDMRTNIVKLIQ